MDENKVIVNELLCFVVNKINLVDNDSLILLCKKFSGAEIVEAKAILKETCEKLDLLGNLRITGRTGNDRDKRNIEDIIAMMHKLGNAGPTFAAADLKKLPPVSFDNIDVTHLLSRLEKLETESQLRREMEDKTLKTIETLEAEIRSLKQMNDRTADLVKTMLEPSLPTPFAKNAGTFEPGSRDCTDFPLLSPKPDAQKGPPPPKTHASTISSAPKKKSPEKSNLVSLTMLKKLREARVKSSIKASNQSADYQEPTPEGLAPPQVKYSEVLKNGEEVPFQVVSTRRKSKSSKLVGTLASSCNEMAAIRSINLFTSWWRPTMTGEEVKTFLKNTHAISSDCKEIPTRAIRYKCFKITARVTKNIDLFNPDIWPEGVQVSRFYNRPKINEKAIVRNRRHSAGNN